MAGFNLVCPFLTDSPEFASGFRLAAFWRRLGAGRRRVREMVAERDEEQFRVAASRCGYGVTARRKRHGWLFVTYARPEGVR